MCLINELARDLACSFDQAACYSVSFPDLYYRSKAYEQLTAIRKSEQQYKQAVIGRLDGLLARPIPI